MRLATLKVEQDFFVRRLASRRNSRSRTTVGREDPHLGDCSRHSVRTSTARSRSRPIEPLYSAARVIVTAGPWVQKLLGAEYARYFRVYRQVLCWFALAKNAEQYAPARFPVFIWIVGNRPRDMLYGFPAIDGPSGGLKIATEQYEATVDPDAVSRDGQ